MQDKIIPEEIEFNDDDIARASRREPLPEGWYRFSITDATKDVSKNQHMMLKLTCAALADPEDASSKIKPTQRHSITLCTRNTGVPGHEPPNTLGFCYIFLRAIEWEGLTLKPFKDENQDFIFDGEIVDKETAAEGWRAADRSVFECLHKIWKDPSQLVDYVFYGQVIENGDYTNIDSKTVSSSLPDNAIMADTSKSKRFIETPSAPTPAPEPKKATAAKASTTTTAKKATNGTRART